MKKAEILAQNKLMFIHEVAYLTCINTPGSFGERARSRSERDGSCIFRGWE